MTGVEELERPDTARGRRDWLTTGAGAALILATAFVVVRSLGGLALALLHLQNPVGPYISSSYWLSYDDGFVRRGLLGEVLRLLAGGAPSNRTAGLAGAALSLLALAAIGWLAVALALRVRDRWRSLLIAAAVLVSPLTVSLYTRDVGRPDTVGVVAVVVLALVPWRRLPGWVLVAAAVVLTTAAVGVGEFLLVIVGPVAAVVLWSRFRRPVLVAAALLPATVLAGLSAVLTPSRRAINDALAEATEAGAPVPTDPPVVDHNAVARLKYSFVDNLRAYYSATDAASVVVMTLLWAAAFLLTVALVWHLLGGSLRQRSFRVLLATGVVVALALSVAGVDYRRWWALVTIAALALMPFLAPEGARPWRARFAVAAVALAALGVALQGTLVFVPHVF